MTRKVWRDVDIVAYVDGELDDEQRAVFEAALDQNAALRHQVETQHRTRNFIRDIPLRTPPRNYLLTSAMVASPATTTRSRRPRSLLVMRLATSLAAVAFIISMGFNLLPMASREAAPSLVLEDDALVEQSAPLFEAPAGKYIEGSVAHEKEEVALASEVAPTSSEQQRAAMNVVEEPIMDGGEGVGNADLPPSAPENAEGLDMGADETAGASTGLTMTNALPVPEPSQPILTPMANGETVSVSLSGSEEQEKGVADAQGTPVTVVVGVPTSDSWLEALSVEEEGFSTAVEAEIPSDSLEDVDVGTVGVYATSDGGVTESKFEPRSILFYVVLGTGVLTLLLAGVTVWLSRRSGK